MEAEKIKTKIRKKDKLLSDRYINLDPSGYFIIKVDHIKKIIFVEHFLNNIDNKGYAIDPITNEPIACDSIIKRKENAKFEGYSAKELGILITENRNDLISKFDHALYLGRELQKAEQCLLEESIYIQD